MDEEQEITPTCIMCGGELASLGTLGDNDWYRCIRCGFDNYIKVDVEQETNNNERQTEI